MTDARKLRRPSGMAGFAIVWAGQIVSVLASSMTQFALTIWVYRETGSATALGGMSTAFLVPFLALAPIAGVMVDRYNRKLMMMVSDLTAVLATAGLLILNALGALQVWHLYVAAVINGLGSTFQWPAYSAAVSTMLRKEEYSRANGMLSLIESAPGVLAPILAGLLLPLIQLTGILTLDVATFFIAIGALLLVHVPQPVRSAEGEAAQGNLVKEALFGFRYIFARRSLLGLLIFFICLNFTISLGYTVSTPFILTRSGQSSAALGAVESAAAIGAVVGGVLVSLWPGFKRRMTNILVGEAMTGVFGLLMFGLGRSLPWWIVFAAIGSITPIYVNGSSQAIWQSKVPPDLQGRVFSARRMIAWIADPVTPILAGLLADYVTEPAMQGQTGLARAFGWLVGTQPGSGMSLQIALAGLTYVAIVAVVALFVPKVRNLETLIPDHDQSAERTTEDTDH